MTNDIQHYKRVVSAMTSARWNGEVGMESFIDRERQMYGVTRAEEKDVDDEIENAKDQIGAWMKHYSLDRWSNQENFVEVWIEKKALQGVMERPCMLNSVALAPCKGYPSLTFLHEASIRFQEVQDREKNVIILYFGDYDPSGEDIPRSLQENLSRMGCDVTVKRIALNKELIEELHLAGVPPKRSDSRTRNWDGKGAVELDAVEPKLLQSMCSDAIEEYFNDELYEELEAKEEKEKEKYRRELKTFVNKFKEDKE